MKAHKSAQAMAWGLWSHIFWYVAANVAQILVWALVTPEDFFWPLWSILGWGVGLVIHIGAFRVASRSLVGDP